MVSIPVSVTPSFLANSNSSNKIALFFFLIVLFSCNQKLKHKDYQKKIIEEYLDIKKELNYEFYNDSLIKEVFEVVNSKKQGRVIQFSSKGLIKRVFNQKVRRRRGFDGDITVFNVDVG